MDEAAITVSDAAAANAASRRSAEPAMNKARAPLRYSSVAILLHWSIAVLILIVFGLALYFNHPRDESSSQAAYQWHMSIGMCVLVFSVLRVAWRLMRRFPILPSGMHIVLRVAAKVSHLLLYVFILAVPLTGWGIMSLRRQTAGMLNLFDWPGIPYIMTHTTHAQRVQYYQFLVPAHSTLAYAGIGLVGLHLTAALYHHFHRRDDVLRRMLPKAWTPSRRGTRPVAEAK